MARRAGGVYPLGWLVLMSIVFYSWWNPAYLLLLAASIGLNYSSARALALAQARSAGHSRIILAAAVCANIALLGYFKYLDFLIGILNQSVGTELPLPHLILPLAISFYTLLQIAFLCDIHSGKVVDLRFDNYLLFVTFFPHMIAGPIIHHSEMMPQFRELAGKPFDTGMLARGLFVFALGLFKKVCIADSLSPASDAGFTAAATLDFWSAWTTALAYSLQLYFDFSGYSDMAIGLALMFGIAFPFNFNSPYRACDIQEFWHRWHITLSRFLRDYVYIGFGGNRRGTFFTYRNLFLTFLVGGIWHGAGWPFVLWGVMHGAAMVVHRAWTRRGLCLPNIFAWPLTFLFVVVAFVMFRAPDLTNALQIYGAMLDIGNFDYTTVWQWRIDSTASVFLLWMNALDCVGIGLDGWVFLVSSLGLALFGRNSNVLGEDFRITPVWALATVVMLITGVLAIVSDRPFIYFQF